MLKTFPAAALLSAVTLAALVPPAHANGWTFTGPQGNTSTFNHWGGGYYGHGPCCYAGGAVAAGVAGLAVGTAVGAAASARPAYVVPPPVVYAPPPPVVYVAPPAYYYTP